MKKFYLVKIALLDEEIAMNEDSIVAVMPMGQPDSYRIWLDVPMTLATEIATRSAKLGGVVPITQDWWDVTSSQLGEFFKPQVSQ